MCCAFTIIDYCIPCRRNRPRIRYDWGAKGQISKRRDRAARRHPSSPSSVVAIIAEYRSVHDIAALSPAFYITACSSTSCVSWSTDRPHRHHGSQSRFVPHSCLARHFTHSSQCPSHTPTDPPAGLLLGAPFPSLDPSIAVRTSVGGIIGLQAPKCLAVLGALGCLWRPRRLCSRASNERTVCDLLLLLLLLQLLPLLPCHATHHLSPVRAAKVALFGAAHN